MKVSVLQEDLLFGVVSVSRFISSRVQLPVLSNILLSSEKGKMRLSATNLEMGISVTISAKTEKEGKTTIPAKIITELIGNSSPGHVSLEEVNGQVVVNIPPLISATLTTTPPNDFPNIPNEITQKDIAFSKEEIGSLVSQVSFAAAGDETRPVLTGILLLFTDGIKAVATDGFRLSLKTISLEKQKQSEVPDKLLIPAKFISELGRIAGAAGQNEDIGMSVLKKEGSVLFSAGPAVLTGKIIEGDFPDFERVMPKRWAHRAVFDKNGLLRAVKTAAVFARESASVVRLKLHDGRLSVLAESQQYGKEEAVIDAKTEGGEVEAAFNYRYILEFLGSAAGDEISFETEGPTSPGVFQDTKDSSYKHLIMPVRIQG